MGQQKPCEESARAGGGGRGGGRGGVPEPFGDAPISPWVQWILFLTVIQKQN